IRQRAGVWYSAGASTGLVLLLQTSRRKLTRLSSTKFASHQKIGFGCITAGKLPSRIFFSPNTNAASTCRREFHVATSSHFDFSSDQAPPSRRSRHNRHAGEDCADVEAHS